MWSLCYFTKILPFLLLVSVAPAKLTSQDLIVKKVTTTVDISTQLVNIQHELLLVSAKNNLRSYIFTVDPLLIKHLSFITATGDGVDTNIPILSRGNGDWEIFFEKHINEGKSVNVVVSTVFSHFLKPYPARIKQDEKHLVLYFGPVSLYSRYMTLNHTSYVKLGTGSVESVIKPIDFDVGETVPLTYTSENPLKPYTLTHTKVHYEHKRPFLTVTELHRTLEISHWGSIRVIEEISLENSGAKLYGPFQRTLQGDNGTNHVKFFTTLLPASASHITIYDELGLISSFVVRNKHDCIEVDLVPRFVLFGGWKTQYSISYNVPSYEYLYNEDEDFTLKMRVVDYIFDDMLIDRAFIKIILPEGSEGFALQTPYPVERQNITYHASYLDVTGRPVVMFFTDNLVEYHIQDFLLSYTFSKMKLLWEPAYIIVFLELIFALIILCSRIDLSITSENHKIKIQCETVQLTKIPQSVNRTKAKRH